MFSDQSGIKTLILILLCSLFDSEYRSNNKEVEQGTVVETIDGDTIKFQFLTGEKEKVRLIGINTPEINQPYGKQAANYTESQLLGKQIYLETDVQDKDKYNRLLRYIWFVPPQQVTDKKIRANMFNADLLLKGYAKAAAYCPDVKYAKYFETFEQEARQNNNGLWAQEEKIKLINFTNTVNCGNYAKVTIQATPGVEYNITVYYDSGASKAAGLHAKRPDDTGLVSWQWKVGCRTKEGTYPIIITGRGRKYEVEFTVVNK